MRYLNPNLCLQLKCPWLSEIYLVCNGRRIDHPSSLPYPVVETDYTSIAPSPSECFLKVRESWHNRDFLKEVQPTIMPVCQYSGHFTFQVPDCCPNVLEHDVLDVGNVTSTQEQEPAQP